LEFVTFHVALGNGEAAHPNQTLQHKEYLSMIGMMFASARLFDQAAKTVVLTDPNTSFEARSLGIDQVIREKMDGSQLMLERATAQLRHVETSAFDSPLVILDSDILVNAPLQPIFREDFDVALTWRHNANQPINGGFLILNNRRPEASRDFFRRFTAIYREEYADHGAWFGDQMALRDCVGLPLSELARRDMVEVDGCRIRLLPCDTHNFSPANRYAEISDDLPEKVILHFKGERKRLMAPYWNAWLRPRRSLSPFVHLRARRERRALNERVAAEAEKGAIPNGDAE
jgi:hypothetical protein